MPSVFVFPECPNRQWRERRWRKYARVGGSVVSHTWSDIVVTDDPFGPIWISRREVWYPEGPPNAKTDPVFHHEIYEHLTRVGPFSMTAYLSLEEVYAMEAVVCAECLVERVFSGMMACIA